MCARLYSKQFGSYRELSLNYIRGANVKQQMENKSVFVTMVANVKKQKNIKTHLLADCNTGKLT